MALVSTVDARHVPKQQLVCAEKLHRHAYMGRRANDVSQTNQKYIASAFASTIAIFFASEASAMALVIGVACALRLAPVDIKRYYCLDQHASKQQQESTMYEYDNELIRISKKQTTDKWGLHWYLKHYHNHFSPIRLEKLNILEIGIGGYHDPNAGGGSLRVWEEYFPFSKIFGIDIADKSPHDTDRVSTHIIDQTDIGAIEQISNSCGGFDIIIDDGSHLSEHIIKSFAGLFPLLKPNGLYVIEDTQTSYWPDWQGASKRGSMEMVKGLIDGLNYKEFVRPGYLASYADRHITAVHAYHSIVFIQKGENWETSNVVENNEPNTITGLPQSVHSHVAAARTFDDSWYRSRYKDLASISQDNLRAHFETSGIHEGRFGSAEDMLDSMAPPSAR